MDQDFLKCFELALILGFVNWLCVHTWDMTSTLQESGHYSSIAFTSCLCRGSRSTGGEKFKLFQAFLSLPTVLHMHVDFLIPRNTSESLKKNSMYILFPDFSLSFLVRFSLVPTISLPQVAAMLSSCQWPFFFFF